MMYGTPGGILSVANGAVRYFCCDMGSPGFGLFRLQFDSQRLRLEGFARGMELPGHFVCHGATHADARQRVWASGLDPANLFDERGGNVFDPLERCRLTIESSGLQPVERLVGAEQAGEFAVAQDVASACYCENRSAWPRG
jgi:hypothetical protein